MKRTLRLLAICLLAFVVTAIAAWGALVLWFTVPLADGPRGALALLFVALALGGLVVAGLRRRIVVPLLPFALASLAVLFWWWSIEPSNARAWQADVARLPSAEIEDDLVTLRNVRSFAYRSASDYTERWYDRTVDLSQLEALDLIAVYWMGDDIAHTMLSFVFTDGEPVTISIETRKEQGEDYSTLAGFFRRYELYYVVGDEHDLIGLRTTYREPPEDVYLYRVHAPRENVRRLFLGYLAKINQLHERPEFYNTGTTNCTTNIVTHIRAIRKGVPLSWKMLFSGYFPELVYEYGALDQSLPFATLRQQSRINERARTADGANFSCRIREGLPGMPVQDCEVPVQSDSSLHGTIYSKVRYGHNTMMPKLNRKGRFGRAREKGCASPSLGMPGSRRSSRHTAALRRCRLRGGVRFPGAAAQAPIASHYGGQPPSRIPASHHRKFSAAEQPH